MKSSVPCSAPLHVSAGRADLGIDLVFGESTVTSSCAASPMKLLAPCARGQSVWAYASSFGGGLVAGDQTRLGLRIGAGTKCFFGTQATTKVYRNPGQLACGHTTTARLENDALLVFAPEPVQAFAHARYTQEQEFHLAAGAGLVLLDWYCSGRAARGERWDFAHLRSRNAVFLAGERIFFDSLLLDPSVGAMGAMHRTGRFNCFAMLLLVGPPVCEAARRITEEISGRAVEPNAALLCSASALPSGAILRLAGARSQPVGQELHRHLKFLEPVLGDDPWIRKW